MTTISNKRRKKISTRTAVFLISITIILCAGLLWRDAAANILWKLLSPMLSARNEAAVGTTGFFGQFGNSAKLAEENKRLSEALASTTARLVDRDYLFAENLSLKAMLGRAQKGQSVLAAVLLRPPGVPYGTLMLDVGSQHKVKEGDLVASEGSAYIGRVSNVYDTTSRVILFSAPGQNYQGLLRGSIPITISGEGGGSMMGEVPSGIEVKVGDPILLPSITPEFMGKITAILETPGQSFQTIFVTLPVNPLELRFVLVYISP
jgi:cell shape-determining protein MreC